MGISIKNILKSILLFIFSNHLQAQSYEYADTITKKIEINYTPMGLLFVKSKKVF